MLELEDPGEASKALLSAALKNGAPDNVTAIVAKIDEVKDSNPASSRWRSLLRRGSR
jgi:hypothetical protein